LIIILDRILDTVLDILDILDTVLDRILDNEDTVDNLWTNIVYCGQSFWTIQDTLIANSGQRQFIKHNAIATI